MYDYNLMPKREIICVDLKSFFASVSCILKGLNPMEVKLAVVGDTKSKGSVVLAATPELKKLGIKTGNRLFEIPKRSDIYIINPTMKIYLDYSAKITSIALKYVAEEDFHQYSIDEFFMDITHSYKLFADTPYDFSLMLQNEIHKSTEIFSTVGIGDNMLLAKVSLDIEAKHTKDGIAEWRYQDVPKKLWPIKPLKEFWGISTKTQEKLHAKHIYSIGDLANYPVHFLKRDFGIVGVDLHLHANGIDNSSISEDYAPSSPSIGKSQILMRDYKFEELYVVLFEHVDEVTHRLRMLGKMTRTVSVSVGSKDGEHFRKQFTVKEGTNNADDIMKEVWRSVRLIANPYLLYRTISVSYGNLISDNERQYSMFDDFEKIEKQEALAKAIVEIRKRYGHLSVMRALSCTDASTLKLREGLIAGHKR